MSRRLLHIDLLATEGSTPLFSISHSGLWIEGHKSRAQIARTPGHTIPILGGRIDVAGVCLRCLGLSQPTSRAPFFQQQGSPGARLTTANWGGQQNKQLMLCNQSCASHVAPLMSADVSGRRTSVAMHPAENRAFAAGMAAHVRPGYRAAGLLIRHLLRATLRPLPPHTTGS